MFVTIQSQVRGSVSVEGEYHEYRSYPPSPFQQLTASCIIQRFIPLARQSKSNTRKKEFSSLTFLYFNDVFDPYNSTQLQIYTPSSTKQSNLLSVFYQGYSTIH